MQTRRQRPAPTPSPTPGDPPEFLPLSIPAVRDEDADGKFDRLDPARDFVIVQITRNGGVTTITWNSVPGKTYQVESCDQIGGSWIGLDDPVTATAGDIALSANDPSNVPIRFYRVQLVNP